MIQEHIRQTNAMVYLDFIDDVNGLTIALREKGVQRAAYHGDKMSTHDKAKVIANCYIMLLQLFSNEKILWLFPQYIDCIGGVVRY